MTTKINPIKRWMLINMEDYRDPLTDEISLTLLAEAACDDLNGYDGDDIPEEYFEIAFEVAGQ